MASCLDSVVSAAFVISTTFNSFWVNPIARFAGTRRDSLHGGSFVTPHVLFIFKVQKFKSVPWVEWHRRFEEQTRVSFDLLLR